MFRQWKTMGAQIKQMEASGEQTDKLIEHAGKSADAALLNAQAVINAETTMGYSQDRKRGGATSTRRS
jgi:hypothetical protein